MVRDGDADFRRESRSTYRAERTWLEKILVLDPCCNWLKLFDSIRRLVPQPFQKVEEDADVLDKVVSDVAEIA